MNMKVVRRLSSAARLALLVAGSTLVFSGCGIGSGLSAGSSCKDFMAASQEEQTEAISKLSSRFDTPEVATPLGSPSIAYTCSSNPGLRLEDLFHKEHEGERTGI